MHALVLASQSPRRKELLERAGFEFTVASVQISEIPNKNLSLPDQICDLAWQKAKALVESQKLAPKLLKEQAILLLAADTVVVLGGEILGKPADLGESERHIRRLSGRTHSVLTGVCIWEVGSGHAACACETAEVTFHELAEEQARAYVATGEGMDKAGAYGAQGEGARLIARLEGSLDNVMGLPISLVERMLDENGWIVKRQPAPARR
jgi:septum formation protein